MKKNTLIIIVSTVVLVLTLWLVMKDNIGISEKNVESDARWSQNIPSDWNMAQSLGNGVVAMVFFPYDNSDCIYSIYIKRPGLCWGYFFEQAVRSVKLRKNLFHLAWKDIMKLFIYR